MKTPIQRKLAKLIGDKILWCLSIVGEQVKKPGKKKNKES